MAPLTQDMIRYSLPYPIAKAWHRATVSTNDKDRIDRLIECNEVLLRTLGALLLPDYLRGEPSPKLEKAIRRLDCPGDGTWLRLVRSLIQYVGRRTDPPPFIGEIYSWYFAADGKPNDVAGLLDEVVRVRNLVRHSVATPVEQTERMKRLQTSLRDTLLTMDWLTGYRPFRIIDSAFARRSTSEGRRLYKGRIQFFVGLEENPPVPAQWDADLVDWSVYATNPEGTALLDLTPFLEFLSDPATMKKHLYLFQQAPEMSQIVRTHVDSEMRSEMTFDEEQIRFDAWLGKRSKIPFHHALDKTAGGVFCAVQAVADRPVELESRFEVLGELGRGGMATVYRVRDKATSEQAALKVLSRHLSQDDACRERFAREAASMMNVVHPRIVPALEVGTLTSGQPFIRMPVMRGNLQQQIGRGRRCEESTVRRWAEDALAALERVHAAGIVHRDIKPSNFLLGEDGSAMLTDFGIALLPDDPRLTQTQEHMGTVPYMAPEQSRERTVTTQADIYALATVLHELVTGELPRDRPGFRVPGELGELIRRMARRDPAKRITATEALTLLRTVGSLTPRPRPTNPSGRITPPSVTLRSDLAVPSDVVTLVDVVTPADVITPSDAVTPRFTTMITPYPTPADAATEQRYASAARNQKIAAGLLLATLFLMNYVETGIETWLRSKYGLGVETEWQLSHAVQAIENGLSFASHDRLPAFTYIGYSIVYFFVFPILAVGVAALFALRRNPRALLVLATAATVDYLLSLPFFLFFPVPERWTSPESGAILLSDLWTSELIQAFRPFSGLNNCFPSFHVSITIVVMLCIYRARAPFRTLAIPLAIAVVLSTFALGIHWLPDIVAGAALGLISVRVAERLLNRLAKNELPLLGWLPA